MQNEDDMQQDSTSLAQDISVTQQYPLDILPTAEVITPISSDLEMTNKRTFLDVIETEQEDSSETSKR